VWHRWGRAPSLVAVSTLSAVLFDIDGTLVDSNYVHVATWSKALAELGHPVDSWRIHRAIGMSGGARELIQTLTGRGLRIVLATSAPDDELQVLRKVLQAGDADAPATSASDVASAKPEPDIVEAALEKARASASAAIMVGDTVWDVESAARAGVRCVAVCAGGTGALELRDAGAAAVYDDVADLLAQLGASPLAPS
jgi:HAD superfamily hydrolase (TIGR01509 family)